MHLDIVSIEFNLTLKFLEYFYPGFDHLKNKKNYIRCFKSLYHITTLYIIIPIDDIKTQFVFHEG